MKTLTLCADDFGMSMDIGETIVSLALEQRLQAVTCLVASPDWTQHQTLLKFMPTNLELGLHFSLTNGGWSSSKKIERELRLQWDIFCASFGRSPDFMDGHCYVHQLPGVRQIFLNFARQVKYVRGTGNIWSAPSLAHPKEMAIKLVGQGFYRLARKMNVVVNDEFLGIYSFSKEKTDYAQFFEQSLGRIQEKAIWVCHPGQEEAWRRKEWLFLKSAHFQEIVSEQQLKLAPYLPRH